MNIKSRTEFPRFDKFLGSVDPGVPFQFEKVPHQKHADGSIFIPLRVPTQYIAMSERVVKDDTSRIMVANLATGAVSLVTHTRPVRYVDAEVVTDGL